MEFTQSVKRNMTTGAYAQISGRASRSEYWWFVLFTLIASAAAGVLDVFFPGDLLQSLFSIAIFIPGIALGIRRMHDIGKSGWWLLIGLIPIIGWIVLIVWLATKSDAGSNQWGVTERV
jgi:uncharacterized membrane protein YhaH (DUF805 family)